MTKQNELLRVLIYYSYKDKLDYPILSYTRECHVILLIPTIAADYPSRLMVISSSHVIYGA